MKGRCIRLDLSFSRAATESIEKKPWKSSGVLRQVVVVVAWSDRATEATTEILNATACLTTFTRRSGVCVCE